MSTEETQQVVESEILTEEQIKETVEGKPDEVVEETLPSDVEEFEIPEKFQGKSLEDVIKSYQELEKMQGTPKDDVPSEEAPKEETKEVDPEYEQWKAEKTLRDTLEPIGGIDKYKEALAWATDNIPAAELKTYEDALSATDDVNTIQLLTKGLMDRMSNAPKEVNPMHSAETTKMPKVAGYSTKSEMMQDMQDPRYDKDASYRAKVEAKLAKTDESKWYAGLARG